ncbi:hypothetical protein F4782DRAFT_545005 [Xylaria castorea]|nr:hypothetical protein F4782DRAFT_545005 [Xylaria castorea]
MAHHNNTRTTVCGQPAANEKINWCPDCFCVTLQATAQLGISPNTQAVLDPFNGTNPHAKVLIRALNLQDAIDEGHYHLFALVQAFVLQIVDYAHTTQLYNINKVGILEWPSDIARQDPHMTNQQVWDWLEMQNLPAFLPDQSVWKFLGPRKLNEPQNQHQQVSTRGDQDLIFRPALASSPPSFQDCETSSSGNKAMRVSLAATGGSYHKNVHRSPCRPTTPPTPTQNVGGYQLQLVSSFLGSSSGAAATPSPPLRRQLFPAGKLAASRDLISPLLSLVSEVEAGQSMTPAVPMTPRTNAKKSISSSAHFQLTPNLETPRRAFPGTPSASTATDRSLFTTVSSSVPTHTSHRQGYSLGPQAQPQAVNNTQGNSQDIQAILSDYEVASARYFDRPTKANQAELDRLGQLLHKNTQRKSQG